MMSVRVVIIFRGFLREWKVVKVFGIFDRITEIIEHGEIIFVIGEELVILAVETREAGFIIIMRNIVC
jgi:hypothetical protein